MHVHSPIICWYLFSERIGSGSSGRRTPVPGSHAFTNYDISADVSNFLQFNNKNYYLWAKKINIVKSIELEKCTDTKWPLDWHTKYLFLFSSSIRKQLVLLVILGRQP